MTSNKIPVYIASLIPLSYALFKVVKNREACKCTIKETWEKLKEKGHELKLTEEQKAQISEILEENKRDVKSKIRKILDEEQKEVFDKVS